MMPSLLKTLLRLAVLCGAGASSVAPATAWAADRPAPLTSPLDGTAPFRPLFVRLGATGAFFDSGLSGTSLAGQPVTGGGVRTPPVVTASVEAGYFLTRQIAVSISGGWPPLVTQKGTGVLSPFGTLARERAGALTATAHYHVDLGRFHPYVGGGVAYAVVFNTIAGAIAQPDLHDGVGGVVVGGVDFDLADRWSLFLDAKNIWTDQRMTGRAAPFPGGPAVLPLKTRIRTDLVLLTAGVGYRF